MGAIQKISKKPGALRAIAMEALCAVEDVFHSTDHDVQVTLAKRVEKQVSSVCPERDSVQKITFEVREMKAPVVIVSIDVRDGDAKRTITSEFSIDWDEIPDKQRKALILHKRHVVVVLDREKDDGR